MNKFKTTAILRILLSLFLLILLFYLARKNFSKIWQLLSATNLYIFILAFLLFIVGINIMAWRLGIVLSTQNASFAVRDLLYLTFIGYFFTNFMPTSIGGDLVKGYFISRKLKSRLSSFAAVFIDRLAGFFSIVLIASVALMMMKKELENKFIFWIVCFLLLFSLVLILLLMNKKILKKIGHWFGLVRLLRIFKLDAVVEKIYTSVNTYANYKKRLLYILLLSIVAQSISFLSVYFLSNSLSVFIPFGKILLVMPIIAVLCMLPITMNGLGVREWGFVFFFSSDIGEVGAVSLSLLYLALFLLTGLIGGIVYLIRTN
jgi:hypothetical protein